VSATTFEKKALWSGVSLAGILLGFLGNFVWSRVDAHEGRLVRVEERTDEIKEIRQDVREIRDAVRRLEGARDVSVRNQ
jgi:F0F1-type ATP synthase membrane subunit b/b'